MALNTHSPMSNSIEDSIWSLFNSFGEEEVQAVEKNTLDPTDAPCEHCRSQNMMLDEGNIVCMDCGTIYDRFIDSHAEWRFYGHDDSKSVDPTRCGMPTNDLLPNSSLGTFIGSKGGECYQMRLIRKYQMWNSMTYKERSLYNIFDTLTVNAVNYGIPATIIDEAKALYKKISEQKLSRGDNRCGLIASSIYMSCKTHNVPRSAKEIAQIFNIKTTVMTKGCKKFQEILNMELESSNAGDFIQRFCSKMNLESYIRELCAYVVEKADEHSIVSANTPISIAAGCIYLVCKVIKHQIDKKELSDVAQISVVTLSKCYKVLHNYRQYLFSDEMKAKYNII